jgi:hypothetical protein
MAQESLLQMLEDLAGRVRSLELQRRQTAAMTQALEHEKSEALTKAATLEREVGELISLVNQAGAKVQEILQIRADDDVSQPQTAKPPAKSTALGQLGEFSSDPKRQQEGGFPGASSSD